VGCSSKTFSTFPFWVFSVQAFIQVTANITATIGIMKFGNINNNTSSKYMSYGFFSSYFYLLGTLTSHVDKLIIGFFFGLEKLAIFAVGELIYNYFFKVPKSFLDQIFMPRLAEMQREDAARWIKSRQPFLIIGMLFMISLISLVLPSIYKSLFSVKYTESILYAYLFLSNIFFSAPVLLVGAMLKAHGMKKETAIAQTIISFVPLILIFPFAYFWGLKGIVFARIGQNISLSSYYYFLVKRIAK
jgi:O-antigen/teichoic acid export membrane protein